MIFVLGSTRAGDCGVMCESTMTETSDVKKLALREQPNGKSDLSKAYDESFYQSRTDISLVSARIYLKFLWQFFQPVSVLDVGCGRGAWLKACHELGSKTLIGFDGNWNSQSSMIEPSINFQSIDLNEPFSLPREVDFAISLEVAEHLEPSAAPQFIECITNASDVILFSAAYTKQEGPNHINEQPHTYWARLFLRNDFVPFDIFRPKFWGNDEIEFWYRQNTFLYAKKNSSPYRQIRAHGFNEMANMSFMNCIHPALYEIKTQEVSVRRRLIPLSQVGRYVV
jgi:SAM-dependent methyltransferase